MARQPKLNAAWYTHPANLRNDRYIKAIRSSTGMAGYGILHCLLEALTDADYTTLKVDALELEMLAGDFNVSTADIQAVLTVGQKIGYFLIDSNDCLSCPELDKWLTLHFVKREQAKTVARPKLAGSNIDNVLIKQNNCHSLSQLVTACDSLLQPVTAVPHSIVQYSTVQNSVIVCDTDVSHKFAPVEILNLLPAVTAADETQPQVAPPPSRKHKPKAGDDPMFVEWWELYGKKTNRLRTMARWNQLSQAHRQLALDRTPAYVISQPDPHFRKDPAGWLADERFHDELPAAAGPRPIAGADASVNRQKKKLTL